MQFRVTGLFLVFYLFSFTTFSQEVVRGEVKDKKFGEPVYGVTIKVDGAGKARTDFDGAFTFKLAPGNYTITASNEIEGYIDEDVEVEVVSGIVTIVSIEIGKDKSVQEIAGVKVTAVKSVGSPTTLEGSDKRRMEESAASDELPKETITNSGVTNAADAVAMVPAASVEDGKNVYIRGLGDRYTKTILNNMEIPGLDPDRNSVQMDIFPAVMIDNITVYKTFTPNLNGDFTGGLVNIQTKDFPGRKTLYFKGGLGYNTRATFNPNFLTYDGGAIDFLGIDDGSRGLPVPADRPNFAIPHPAAGELTTEKYTAVFGKTMAAETGLAFLNQSYAFAIGDQITFPKKKDSTKNLTYGYNALVNYRSNNTFYSDVEYNEYLRDPDSTEYKLFKDRQSFGSMGQRDVIWTALLGQSIKFNRNKISLVAFHTQNGTSQAAELSETNYDSNQARLAKTGLQFTQRSISNVNLSGLHFLDTTNHWKLNWTVTPTYSRIVDPDIRSTSLERPDYDTSAYLWEESVGAEVRRIFRDLTEYNVSGRFDFEHKSKKKKDSLESIISFGGMSTYKNRSFDVYEFIFRLDGMTNNEVPDGDPNWFFTDENLWTVDKDSGVYAVGQQELANIYDANQLLSGTYLMHEYPFSKAFSATYGVRAEYNVNRYTGENTTQTVVYNNEKVLEKFNVLPSINLIYKIRKDADSLRLERSTNLRAAYSQTVARPSFREISISQIYDPIQGRRYLGNIDLKQTLIHNADLRWEHFFGRTELVSASAFYKRFINPIEVVANVAAPNEFKPVNAGVADVYGAEFEIRKTLWYNEESGNSLIAGTNFTYVISRIDMREVQTVVGQDTLTELSVRLDNVRDMDEYNKLNDNPFRPMYGQSPWIVNAYVTYKNDSTGWMANLTYNVQGKKLAVIGVGALPDVYELPFHSLNLKVSKTFGKVHDGESATRWKATFRAQNLLNMIGSRDNPTGQIGIKRKFYEAYKAAPQIFEYLNPGMTFSASVAYTIR